MPEGNVGVVQTFIADVINGNQTDLLTDLVTSDHVGHHPSGDHYGPEGIRIVIAELRMAFPDLVVTIEDLVAARDKVVWRFSFRGTHGGPYMGIPPTGRRVTTAGIAIERLEEGRIAESWMSLDALRLLRQMGARPALQVAREEQR